MLSIVGFAPAKDFRMDRDEIEIFEKTIGRMEGLHKEISALARKSPNDALNKFKLKFVNAALAEALIVLGQKYSPLEGFTQFDEDDLPSNSDVTFIISHYLEEIERKRADNISSTYGGWCYTSTKDSKDGQIRTAPPKKIEQRK
jgi:hypothetical protein